MDKIILELKPEPKSLDARSWNLKFEFWDGSTALFATHFMQIQVACYCTLQWAVSNGLSVLMILSQSLCIVFFVTWLHAITSL